ncbi:MAG: peptide deformylase [Candidatus Brennerbacteria bacterium]|nr:peptide deformylase [Candidatus Brennerbacteria bacterium]
MKILTIQNKIEEKFLRRPAKLFDFSKFSKKEIQELIKKMRKEMKAAQGVGLSANQIGLDMKVFVAEAPSERGAMKFYAVFNPDIKSSSKETFEIDEGCLSVPDFYGKVKRPAKIILNGFDKNGKNITIKAWGFLARVFQHETDHLNGILFTDKISRNHHA